MKALPIIISIYLVKLSSIYGAIQAINYQNQNDLQTVPCIIRLCEFYFKPQRALKGSLAIVNLIPNPTLFQRRILELLNEDRSHKLGVMVKDAQKVHLNASHVTEKAQNYFMLLSNSTELIDTIIQLKNLPTWNPLAQVIILFTNDMDDKFKNLETNSVLQELFTHHVLNVNVMSVRQNTTVVEVVTWFPYEGSNCANKVTQIRLINECEYLPVTPNFSTAEDNDTSDELPLTIYEFRERKYFTHLFPKIPHTLHDCPLHIASTVWEPYVVAHKGVVTKGFEVLMLKTITEKMKLTLNFSIIEQNKAHAFLTANNLTGLYASLMQRKADIMIGGLSENPISRKFLSSTIPYYQDDLTWCVATAKLAPNWLNVFIIFNKVTWAIAIITLVALAVIFYVFVKLEGKVKENYLWSFIITLSLNINFTGHYAPRKTFVRIFLVGVMIYGLHFSAAYNSFLIAVLTRPRFQAQVNKIELAIESNFHMFGGENIKQHFEKPDWVSQHVNLAYQSCNIPDNCLKMLKSNQSMAVAISRQHSRNSPTIMPSEMFCFSTTNNIYTYSVAMIVKRNHHLLAKINDHIRSISESGLLKKWEQESQTTKVSQVDESEAGNDGIILRLEHIEGAFLLGFVGIAVSTLAFIGEHLHFWWNHKRKNRKLRGKRQHALPNIQM